MKSFGKQIGTTPNPYAAYGAQAMDVMLAGDRQGRRQACLDDEGLFGLTVTNGILGNFTINAPATRT